MDYNDQEAISWLNHEIKDLASRRAELEKQLREKLQERAELIGRVVMQEGAQLDFEIEFGLD